MSRRSFSTLECILSVSAWLAFTSAIRSPADPSSHESFSHSPPVSTSMTQPDTSSLTPMSTSSSSIPSITSENTSMSLTPSAVSPVTTLNSTPASSSSSSSFFPTVVANTTLLNANSLMPTLSLTSSLTTSYTQTSSTTSSTSYISSTTQTAKLIFHSPTPSSKSASKRPTGAIVGGTLGAITGLLLFITAFFFCRKHRKLPYPSWRKITFKPRPNPDLIKFDSAPEKEWLAKLDNAMEEAAIQTERARSRTGSSPRPLSEYQSTSSESTCQPQQHIESRHSTKTPDFDSMPPEERERRQQELLDRMRSILDRDEESAYAT